MQPSACAVTAGAEVGEVALERVCLECSRHPLHVGEDEKPHKGVQRQCQCGTPQNVRRVVQPGGDARGANNQSPDHEQPPHSQQSCGVRCQAVILAGCQWRPSRAMALRMVSSLRMQATRATLWSLPALVSRS